VTQITAPVQLLCSGQITTGIAMSSQNRSPGLRLEVEHEAIALISIWGSAAHSIARRRAEEASSEQLVNDWDSVARVIGRKSGERAFAFQPPFPSSRR
jgi:hypothetical protein